MNNPSVDIRALAKLARLEVGDDEIARLEKEIPAILGFVEAIQKAPVSGEAAAPEIRNVMRDDAGAHESGAFTDALLKAAPNREGDRIAVKQVISRKTK